MICDVTKYGAVGDGQKLGTVALSGDFIMHAGSPILTALNGLTPFVSGDVNKTIWVNDNSINKLIGQTTIAEYISPTEVQLAKNATRDAATVTNPNASIEVTWGTDDANALLAAQAASVSRDTIYAPSAPNGMGYILTKKWFNASATNAANFVGEGRSATVLYPSMDITLPGGHLPVWMDISGGQVVIKDFWIEGPNYLLGLTGFQPLIRAANCRSGDIDFRMTRVGCVNDPSISPDYACAIQLNAISQLNYRHDVQNLGPDMCHNQANVMVAARVIACGGTVHDSVLSNFNRNLVIDTCGSRQGLNAGGRFALNFQSTLIDENGGLASLQIINGSLVNMTGMIVWVGGDGVNQCYACHVDGTSTLYATDCDFGSYFLNVGGLGGSRALLIDAGGKVVSRGSTYRSVSAGLQPQIDNFGDFVDEGGNNAFNGSSGTNVPMKFIEAFKNPTRVLRGSP